MAEQSGNGASTALKVGLAATGSLAIGWVATTPAVAQPAPAYVAPVYDPFNSFSIGIGGGWDWFRAPASVESYDDFGFQGDSFSPVLTGNGGFGTLEIGKDFRFGQGVLGIYGDYAFGHKDGSASHSVETSGEG